MRGGGEREREGRKFQYLRNNEFEVTKGPEGESEGQCERKEISQKSEYRNGSRERAFCQSDSPRSA